jgi:hypothetical protein
VKKKAEKNGESSTNQVENKVNLSLTPKHLESNPETRPEVNLSR